MTTCHLKGIELNRRQNIEYLPSKKCFQSAADSHTTQEGGFAKYLIFVDFSISKLCTSPKGIKWEPDIPSPS